ncbi:VTC domain-containing protein [Arthrobacter sp. MN05-02]|nr:VTC domain-containing protein [Arthrobacter sp. MN05-02]
MSAGAFAGLDRRASVSLEDLNTAAALQTRMDRKYVVGVRLAADLLRSFDADVRVLEILGRRSFTYDSVYFDTPALDSYLLAARGRRRRYKIRTRTYVDSAVSFLEVKTEGARSATVKERIPYEPSDSHRLTAHGLDYVNGTLARSIGSVPAGVLQPVIETRYRRITLYLPGSESRATIDLGVTWRRPGGQAHELDGAVIIETKSGSAAGALDRHLWASGLRPGRISKFATGMAALDPTLPANRWHRTVSTSLPLRPLAR